MAAASTATAACAARLTRPPARCTTSGTRGSSPKAASTGPVTNRSPCRASRQFSTSQPAASAPYTTAARGAAPPPFPPQPPRRECAVHDRGALGDVPDREDGNRENERQARARIEP